MTQEQEIVLFNQMLDIALGIGGAGQNARHEQDPGSQELLKVAERLAAMDFQDEFRPSQVLKKQAGRKVRAASPAQGFLPRRRAALVLMAVLALMVATVLAVGPERALAALRGLLGYIPGIGLVDNSAGLRVLAEPVSQTRGGHGDDRASRRQFATHGGRLHYRGPQGCGRELDGRGGTLRINSIAPPERWDDPGNRS